MPCNYQASDEGCVALFLSENDGGVGRVSFFLPGARRTAEPKCTTLSACATHLWSDLFYPYHQIAIATMAKEVLVFLQMCKKSGV